MFGKQGTQPDGSLRDFKSHHLLAGHGYGQLAEERGLPVVAIRQHQDLPVIAYLEQLLGPSMHRTHDDAGGGNHVALSPQP